LLDADDLMLPLLAVPIVVDLAVTPAIRTELSAILVEACSRAAGGEGCVLLDREQPRTSARALAVVRFDGAEHQKIAIEVAVIGSPERALRSRDLAFREEDPPSERFRTAGLTIALLAAGDSGDEGGEPQPPAPPPSAPWAWSAGAGALVGTGIESGPVRVGGWVAAAAADPRSPLFAAVSGSYAQTSHDLQGGMSVRWLTFAFGGGLRTVVQPLHAAFRIRLDGFVEWTIASVRELAPVATDTAQSVGLGARAGLDVAWPADSQVQVVAGAEGFLRPHAIVVRMHDQPAATVPLGGYNATVGLHVSLR
jgi:hypothetical protein